MELISFLTIFGFVLGLYAIITFLGSLDFPNTQLKDFQNIDHLKTNQLIKEICKKRKKEKINNIRVGKICFIYNCIIPLRILGMIPLPIIFFVFLFGLIGNFNPIELTIDLTGTSDTLLFLGIFLEIMLVIIKISIGLPQTLMKLHPDYHDKSAITVVFEIYPIVNI